MSDQPNQTVEIIKGLVEQGILQSGGGWNYSDRFAMQARERSKAYVPPHGASALLSAPGVNPNMPSAIRQAQIWGLPLFQSRYRVNKTEIFTALDAMTGDNADNWCDTPPVVGNLRLMQIQREFGEWFAKTNNIPVPDLGERLDLADIDRFSINGLIASNPFTPDVVMLDPAAINTTMGKELIQMAETITRQMALVDYVGDNSTVPASTEKGFTSEYDGLDLLVATGYADAISATAAASVDSIVTNFAGDITGATFVATLSNIIRSLRERAKLVFMPDVVLQIHVNSRMKHALIDEWSCNYQTARCDNTAGEFSLERLATVRDDMLRGNYLLVDGVPINIVDNFAVPATYDASTEKWTSDIYIVPLYNPGLNTRGKVADGVTWLTYREYKPMANEEAMQLFGYDPSKYRTMNNGLYVAKLIDTNMCEDLLIAAKLRLQLDFPFLAGRLDNVTYTYSLNVGSPYTTQSDYVGGGVVNR